MRRICPTFTSIVVLASAAPAVAQQQEPSAPLLFGVQASWMPARDVDGQIEYFKGTTPRSAYREHVGGGVALGGDVGFQLYRIYELHLGVSTGTRTAEREGTQIRQRTTFTNAELRFAPLGNDRVTIPYAELGVSALYASEGRNGSTAAPWPGTTAMWGTSPMLAVGAQRRVGSRAALDVALALFDPHVSRVELYPGDTYDIGARHSLVPQLRVGLAWLPSREELHRAASDPNPLAVERSVRLHTTNGLTRTGSIVAVGADSVVVQTRTVGGLNQVSVPLACVNAIDVQSGNRSTFHSTLASAVQGAVLVGSALLLGRAVHGVGTLIPEKPLSFAAAAVVPGAIAGAAFGVVRERREWVRAPLPAGSAARRPTGDVHC